MKSKKAFVFIILAGLFWGTSGVFVNLLSEYGFTPIQMVATRATVSLLLIGAFTLIKDGRSLLVKPKLLILFLTLAVSLFFSMFLYYSSMVRTSVCTAVILLNLHPIYVTALSAVFYKERITPIKLASIAVMLIGCSFVSGIFGGLALDFVGLLLGILSGVSYASYILIAKYYNRKGIKNSTANVYTFLFMSIIAVFACDPAQLVSNAAAEPLSAVPLLIALGICTSVVPFVLNGIALRDLSAGTVSALSIIEPLSATIYSVAFFGEPMDLWKTLGVTMILGAVIFLGLDEVWSAKCVLHKEKTDESMLSAKIAD
jgi:drug/metabolite transporter (DMT)-like permease